jgi:hypothetical protein
MGGVWARHVPTVVCEEAAVKDVRMHSTVATE